MSVTPRRLTALGAVLFFAGAVLSAQADVKLPAIFGDHMILQGGMKVPVWGTAEPGEKVTVSVGETSASTTAGSNGKWRVDLAPLSLGKEPVTMRVEGNNTITCNDVLIGDVWICSGQSNMQFSLSSKASRLGGAHNEATELPKANDPELRLFVVEKKTALDPEVEIGGKWEVCTPDSAGAFSAVGYFFGRDLRATLKKPIGLIGTYWGGTPAEAWTSIEGLQKDSVLKNYVDTYQKIRANFPKATAEYPEKLAAFKASLATWQKDVEPAYNEALKKWNEASRQAMAAGQTPPRKPSASTPFPLGVPPPDGGSHAPANLFNGMIAPLVPYAIKGVIWYQGESNAKEPLQYQNLFAALITDWREKWNQGNFPFLFVQLARFQSTQTQNWPFLRESQLKTLSLSKTGMAVAVDVGHPLDIHPADKQDVGHRLALAARHVAYGQDIVYSGPIYKAMKADGNAVQITFTNYGAGLCIGSAPWVAPGFQPLPTTNLIGFTIAGEDYKWFPADAKSDGDTVVVSSSQVPKPIAVRYAWANTPEGNLYNKDGLPASPFRTDDLPYDPATAVLPSSK